MFGLLAQLMRKRRKRVIYRPSQRQVSIPVQLPNGGEDQLENQQLSGGKYRLEKQSSSDSTGPISGSERESTASDPGLKQGSAATGRAKIQLNRSFSNNYSHRTSGGEKADWFVVSASATGKSHLGQVPCQDNHRCEAINEEWGIAISCDGAGSAVNSHLGSAYVTNEVGIKFFKELVINSSWLQTNTLPSPEQWSGLAREACIGIYRELERYAGHCQIKLESLACTLIVVVYSPDGLLVTHIGDGRAGFCNERLEWKAIMTPHKGEEANQTIFLTSGKWISDPEFRMSGKPVPECNVITEKPVAFTLLSDGCELHSFECSMMNPENNKWHDPNLPYGRFFNPLVKNLRQMNDANMTSEAANAKWRRFIESGSSGLESEPDDKTMLLGVYTKKDAK